MGRKLAVFMLAVMLAVSVCGCEVTDDGEQKVRDLDFTVVSEDRQPEELKQIIEEKKNAEFKITYADQDYLYICIGYGEQQTGGYSIQVNELYLTNNAVYVDTSLIGPSPEESKKEGASYPYIVLKVEYLDKTVVFK